MRIGHKSSGELVDVEFLVGLNGGRRRTSIPRAPVRVTVPLRPGRPELGTLNCPTSSLGGCQLPVLVLETLDHLVVGVDGAQVVLKIIFTNKNPPPKSLA